jgi:L-fuconolactonase
MAPAHYVDIHPHIISTDDRRYPRSPLFGVQSEWSKARPVAIEGYLAEMEAAGVQQAAIVQASTCYGYDNSYLADSIANYPGRLTAVGTVDLVQPDAPERIRGWMKRGITGLRLFTGGSTREFDPSSLDDPRSFPAWELCSDAGISICLQTDPTGLAQVAGLAKRFPKAKILIDHMSRPDLSDGAPYKKASSLFGLQPFENIHLKLTPRIVGKANTPPATPETFFPRLVAVFGSHRIAWGSNFPATAGPLAATLAAAKESLQCLSAEDQEWIFAKTAKTLYPSLASS